MKKLYEEADVQAVADAIREKNGLMDTYTISQMAAAISAIETGGGGLPYGWATGEFTPEEDTAGTTSENYGIEITHGLGKIPNYVFIYSTSPEMNNSFLRATMLVSFGEYFEETCPEPYCYCPEYEYSRGIRNNPTSTAGMSIVNTTVGYGADGGTNRQTFFLPKTSIAYPYAGGVTYKWIAIRTEE